MFSFLKKPYPYYSFSVRDLYSNFFIGCFVTLFLLIFQPFGISIWETSYKTLKLVGFGFVSFICPLAFRLVSTFILKNKHPEETWMVWKEMLTLVLVICFIALGNLCYGNFIRISYFSFQELLLAMAATFLLAIFPITANVALKYNRFVILNQKDAELMEAEVIEFQKREEEKLPLKEKLPVVDPVSKIIFIAENDKDKLEIMPHELLYLEATDNYSSIVFYKNGKICKQLLRGSLKRFESQINFEFIVRCHRSYIVNLKLIHHIKGNAQGYRIEFKDNIADSIPVSRNYSKALFERLEFLK